MVDSMTTGSVEGLVEELIGCGDNALDERLRGLELERRRIEAELALTANEISRRRSYLDDGHRSLSAYLRATGNYSHGEAARIGRLANAADAVPGLATALHDGHIGIPQADELSSVYANRRVRDRFGEFAPTLLDHAERLSFREFRICIQRFTLFADVDGNHRDVDASIAKRRVRVVEINGELHLEAAGGDPLVNVELAATFRHFCDLEYDADIAARRAEHGDRADEHPLPRTATQRGYDAFVAMTRHALANEAAGRPGRAADPVVNILVDQRTWAQILADAGLAPTTDLDGNAVDPFTGLRDPATLFDDLLGDPADLASRRCETSTGVPLDPHTVLRAALAGHLRRAVLGAASVPINLARRARVFTGAARDAAKLLATTCDHPGCGLDAALCDVDHSTEWYDGGPTDQHNAGVECNRHNREKHRRRWRTRRDTHGRIYTIRADGTIILPAGARPPTFDP
jgi:hypothetical protein